MLSYVLICSERTGVALLTDARPPFYWQVSSPQHLGLKQSAIVSLGGGLWLTTGFSKSRQRWFLLFDSSKDLSQPVSTTGIDFETAPLWPVVDVPRRIVYLAGKVSNRQTGSTISNLVLMLTTDCVSATGRVDPPLV